MHYKFRPGWSKKWSRKKKKINKSKIFTEKRDKSLQQLGWSLQVANKREVVLDEREVSKGRENRI